MIFQKHRPDKVMHLAAETHVDRSIDSPRDFIETNVNGTLICWKARSFWQTWKASKLSVSSYQYR